VLGSNRSALLDTRSFPLTGNAAMLDKENSSAKAEEFSLSAQCLSEHYSHSLLKENMPAALYETLHRHLKFLSVHSGILDVEHSGNFLLTRKIERVSNKVLLAYSKNHYFIVWG
jgi:hypothetical protein